MKNLWVLILLSNWAWAQASQAPTQETSSDEASSAQTVELLPELPAPPTGKATLIGGTVSNLDRVRDEMTIQPFGGGRMRVLFDGRTQIYRDGSKASQRELRTGERVYVDTVLDGSTVFAKNIRVQTSPAMGESRGQILSYDRGRGALTLNDSLGSGSVSLRVTSGTRILRDDQASAAGDLVPGSLVDVRFRPSGDGQGIAEEVSILATPGTAFTFAGRVTFLDMHSGLLVLVDPRDKKSYEIHFDPARVRVNGNLREGAEVTITAGFDGIRYVTSAVMVSSPVEP